MICTLPDTITIMTLLVSLMPNCENSEVLSLIWRLLSLFDSRREKTKSSNENSPVKNTENNTTISTNNNNTSPQNEDKNNSYNLIKFYKPCQPVKMSILPQIIADLLGTFYNKNKLNGKSSNLALQSIYLLFRIDRDLTDDVTNDSEKESSSFDDSSLISNISDLSSTVFNKLNQSEIQLIK